MKKLRTIIAMLLALSLIVVGCSSKTKKSESNNEEKALTKQT